MTLALRNMTLLGLVFVASCQDPPTQATDAVVVEYVSPHAIEPKSVEKFHRDVVIGSDPSTPARIDWTVGLDKEGCRRVHEVVVTRTGGTTDFVIYKAEVKSLGPCVSDLNGAVLFERVLVDLCYRWKGASNDAECAYQKPFTIRGDAVGLEG